jgi:hypothetical protein
MRKLLLVAVLVAWSADARAGEGPALDEKLAQLTKAESLTIEGKGFIRYWYDIQDGDAATEGDGEPHDNSIEIWRFYFGARARLAPWLTLRLTSDVGPEKKHKTSEAGDHSHDSAVTEGTGAGTHTHDVPGETSYQLFLKFAWLEATLARGLSLRAGIVDNPHNDFTDGLWGYRFVARNAGEELKLWNTADLGAYLRYELPSGLGNVVAGVFNGAGYKSALDTDATKEAFGQFVLAPLAPLGEALARIQVAGFVQAQMTGDAERERLITWSGFAGYRDAWFMLGYMVLGRNNRPAEGTGDPFNGLGHSVLARFDTPWKVGLLGRFTRYDSNTGDGEATPATSEALAGISYAPVKLFSVAATSALTWQEKVAGGDETETGIKAMLSTEINF